MTARPTRRDLARKLAVDWSPALAARVRRRLDGAIARRRRRLRTSILALGLLALGGFSYAFSHAWGPPRVLPPPPVASPPPSASAKTPPRPQEPPASVPAPSPVVAPKRPPAAPTARAVAAETVESLFAAADAARLQGRASDAVAPLTAIFTKFPSDTRAAVAAFQLGRVLDDDLHDSAGAAAAFSRALALDPRGPLATDAAARARVALDRAAGTPRP